MRKRRSPLILIVVIGGALIGLFAVARLTGMFNIFRVATSANEPTLKVHQQVMSSNLVDPARYDFIAYYSLKSSNSEQIR